MHERDAELHNVRKVRVSEEQEVWVRFDTYRDDEGYMAIDVVTPPRSDAAILAAIIAYVAEPMEFERLREARRFLHSPDRIALEERIEALNKKIHEAWGIAWRRSPNTWRGLSCGRLIGCRPRAARLGSSCRVIQRWFPSLPRNSLLQALTTAPATMSSCRPRSTWWGADTLRP